MAARILVVEDHPPNLELMSYILAHFGHEVLTATDGEAAIEVARRERPDMILCDVHLPRLDGCGVARQLKRDPSLSVLPLVAVTALAMVGDRDKILAAGFDGYISKPINPATFLNEVESFLAARLRSSGPRAVAPAPAANPVAPPRAARGKVLVVDDAAVNIELYRSTLEPSGYAVFSARDPQEAMTVGEREQPDIILVDYRLGEHDGLAAAGAMRRSPILHDTPVFVISSSVTLGECAAELRAADVRCLIRPLEPQKLIHILDETLDEKNANPHTA